MAKSYKDIAVKYAEDIVAGKKNVGKEVKLACERFLSDMERFECTPKSPILSLE